MSCSSARIIASNILKALSDLQPENKLFFEKNYLSLLQIINKRDSMIQDNVKNNPEFEHKFVIYHPILTYFARDYKLQQLAIEEEAGSQVLLRSKASSCKPRGSISSIVSYKQNLPIAIPRLSSKRAIPSLLKSIHCKATGIRRWQKL